MGAYYLIIFSPLQSIHGNHHRKNRDNNEKSTGSLLRTRRTHGKPRDTLRHQAAPQRGRAVRGKRKRRIVALPDGTRKSTYRTRYRFEHDFPNRHYDRKERVFRTTTTQTGTLEHVAWNQLSSTQKVHRVAALEARHDVRKGTPIEQAAQDKGISGQEMQLHLGEYLTTENGTPQVSDFDRIQRRMPFYENGRKISITVTNSSDASILGHYFNAVQRALKSRKEDTLRQFKRIVIIDANGTQHRLETNLDNIYEIEERKETPSWIVIYELE